MIMRFAAKVESPLLQSGALAKEDDELDQDTATVSIYKTRNGSLCCS